MASSLEGTSSDDILEFCLIPWTTFQKNDITDKHTWAAGHVAMSLTSAKRFKVFGDFVSSLPTLVFDTFLSNEKFRRALIKLRQSQGQYVEVCQLIEEGSFEDGSDLIPVWDNSHYAIWEKQYGKVLNALNRFRVRKRNPPPASICQKGRRTRNLDDAAKTVLTSWLQQHWDHPYPAFRDRERLSAKTGLAHKQIRTWFANARRRKCFQKQGPKNVGGRPRKSGAQSFVDWSPGTSTDEATGGQIAHAPTSPLTPVPDDQVDVKPPLASSASSADLIQTTGVQGLVVMCNKLTSAAAAAASSHFPSPPPSHSSPAGSSDLACPSSSPPHTQSALPGSALHTEGCQKKGQGSRLGIPGQKVNSRGTISFEGGQKAKHCQNRYQRQWQANLAQLARGGLQGTTQPGLRSPEPFTSIQTHRKTAAARSYTIVPQSYSTPPCTLTKSTQCAWNQLPDQPSTTAKPSLSSAASTSQDLSQAIVSHRNPTSAPSKSSMNVASYGRRFCGKSATSPELFTADTMQQGEPTSVLPLRPSDPWLYVNNIATAHSAVHADPQSVHPWSGQSSTAAALVPYTGSSCLPCDLPSCPSRQFMNSLQVNPDHSQPSSFPWLSAELTPRVAQLSYLHQGTGSGQPAYKTSPVISVKFESPKTNRDTFDARFPHSQPTHPIQPVTQSLWPATQSLRPPTQMFRPPTQTFQPPTQATRPALSSATRSAMTVSLEMLEGDGGGGGRGEDAVIRDQRLTMWNTPSWFTAHSSHVTSSAVSLESAQDQRIEVSRDSQAGVLGEDFWKAPQAPKTFLVLQPTTICSSDNTGPESTLDLPSVATCPRDFLFESTDFLMEESSGGVDEVAAQILLEMATTKSSLQSTCTLHTDTH